MNKPEIKRVSSTVDEVRRKLLKLGVYSVPALVFLGKVSGARASGAGNLTGRKSQLRKQDSSELKGSIGFSLLPPDD